MVVSFTTTCPGCGGGVGEGDNFCRHCGLRVRGKEHRVGAGPVFFQNLGCGGGMGRFLFLSCLVALALSAVLVEAHGKPSTEGEGFSEKTDLFQKVGKLFAQEKARQRQEKHETADAVENGPKEISLYCPQDPQVRIVDLDESERDRDVCLVLNIAAPEVSSRLVIFCNAAAEFAGNETSGQSEAA